MANKKSCLDTKIICVLGLVLLVGLGVIFKDKLGSGSPSCDCDQ